MPEKTAPYHSLNDYYRKRFGGKVYKLSVNGLMTCPNRDGTLGTRGCIFCSAGGSGEFAGGAGGSIGGSDASAVGCAVYSERFKRYVPDIDAQLEAAKKLVASKIPSEGFAGYIVYFQAYTNTYAPVDYLEDIFMRAILKEDVVGISIATRPDCLEEDKIELLLRLNKIKPVFVELGLQTIHENTAKFIRRGYPLPAFDDAVSRLKAAGIDIVVHTILGLPYESPDDMLATCRYVGSLGVHGIKLQLLHILCGTDLAEMYLSGTNLGKMYPDGTNFHTMKLEEYASLIVSIIERLPPDIVIHRITGDGPKKLLLAPMWSADKKNVLNTISKEFATRNTWQGKYYGI